MKSYIKYDFITFLKGPLLSGVHSFQGGEGDGGGGVTFGVKKKKGKKLTLLLGGVTFEGPVTFGILWYLEKSVKMVLNRLISQPKKPENKMLPFVTTKYG